MNCPKIKEILVNYLDNGVSDEEKASIEEHLAHCPECTAELEALTTAQNGFRQTMQESISELNAPAHALAAIKHRITHQRKVRTPILSSIKARVARWWKGVRARPVWQQAFILIPMAAVLVGSSAAAIGYAISDSDAIRPLRTNSVFNIYMMDADGTNLVSPTTDHFWDGLVSFSPDGNKILVSSKSRDSDDDRELYLMDIDGSNIVQLTDNDSDEIKAKFSPDGTKILFVSDRDTPPEYIEGTENSGQGDIYVMDLDGSNIVRITETADVNEDHFVWSPDGSKIAFHTHLGRYFGRDQEIKVINADGTGLVDIVKEQDDIYRLLSVLVCWSPDSTQLLFAAQHVGDELMSGDQIDDDPIDREFGLYTANVDGSGITDITPSESISGYLAYPKYSPDGTKIAFIGPRNGEVDASQYRNGDGSLYTMNIDGTNLTELADATYFESTHWWSPDSSRIIYTAEPEFKILLVESENEGEPPIELPVNGHEIFIVNADGTGNTRLTENNRPDLYPTWSPDGARILFFRVEERIIDPDEDLVE